MDRALPSREVLQRMGEVLHGNFLLPDYRNRAGALYTEEVSAWQPEEACLGDQLHSYVRLVSASHRELILGVLTDL